jgi:DNA-binding CsgD family transcriptional regulator
VAHTTPGAIETLAQYLPIPEGQRDALPRRIRDWLRKVEDQKHPEPLIVSRDSARLTIRYAPSEGRRLLLLTEGNCPARLDQLERFSLTGREREVLRWLAEGKSNAEIATILGLTSGTVKVHVERILEKLGVENRVMAALAFHGVAL